MNRGMREAKTPKQVKADKKKSNGVAAVLAQVAGIGLLAGAALIFCTDKVLSKLTEDDADEEE